MPKRYETGDVHAPVEDVDVPLSLKVLVVSMFSILIGAAIALTLAANQLGLLNAAR